HGFSLAGGGVDLDLGSRASVVSSPGGRLSMRLTELGRGSALRRVSLGAALRAHANRVTRAGSALSEWYAAGPFRLEPGFTVAHRPAGVSGPVTLVLRLSGRLRPRRSGASLSFVDAAGRPALTYSDLSATDADGRPLHASLTLDGRDLRISVRDSRAAYPIRI